MEYDNSYGSVAFPIYVTVKASGAQCNLNCEYCSLRGYDEQSKNFMSVETLEKFTKQYIDAQIHSAVKFCWEGGEPLLRGIDFFKKAVEFQKKFGIGRKIFNDINTNGVLIDEDWSRFFKENDFNVKISIDGPRHCHDRNRIKKDGNGSFDDVMHGVNMLKRFGVRFSIISNVNEYNVFYPFEIYSFFKSESFRNIQFKPVFYKDNLKSSEYNEFASCYGNFLCTIFDEWVRNDIGKFKIVIFDETLNSFCRNESSSCIFAQTCGHKASAESNGDLYACNQFTNPEYFLGNMIDHSLTGLMYGRKQLKFGQMKKSNLTSQCKKCRYLKFCNGGCLKDRLGISSTGEKGHNIYCSGYYKFFDHVTPAMTFMAAEIASGKSPARIMTFFE
ncbi:MAG: anaerobic sulfatase maturase [Bacteroidales bacterium]|nr:anaerobic sulfatase maturase [Bacteroidales bacterium]